MTEKDKDSPEYICQEMYNNIISFISGEIKLNKFRINNEKDFFTLILNLACNIYCSLVIGMSKSIEINPIDIHKNELNETINIMLKENKFNDAGENYE